MNEWKLKIQEQYKIEPEKFILSMGTSDDFEEAVIKNNELIIV